MEDAEKMLLADAIECCIEAELKIKRLKAVIIMLSTLCVLLAVGFIFG